MADRIIFVATSPEEFIRGVNVPQQMISDFLEISRVPLDAIEQVGVALEQAEGFLDNGRLEELVKASIPGETAADAVVNAVRNLRAETLGKTLDAVEKWRECDPGRRDEFPDEAIAAVKAALPRLVRPSAAVDRGRKAKRLRSVIGNQARQVEIICDARPVFDREQRTIEGFVTQTTLKLVYETQTDDTNCIEVVLTPKMLVQLREKAEKAQKKLEVLWEGIQNWIPDGLAETKSQITEGNES
jgi:hypothetical protein